MLNRRRRFDRPDFGGIGLGHNRFNRRRFRRSPFINPILFPFLGFPFFL